MKFAKFQPALVGAAAIALSVAIGCDGGEESTDSTGGSVNISGSQSGGSNGASASTAEMGSWVDAGDGVKVAVLDMKLADHTGGVMLKDEKRAVGVLVQIANTSDKQVNGALKPIKLLTASEQHGIGMSSAAAVAEFKDDNALEPMVATIGKLLPGQVMYGWTTFAPLDAETGEMSILVGKNGNPMRPLADGDIAARVPLSAGSASDRLDPGTSLKPNHELNQAVTGGATDITVTAFGKAETDKPIEEGHTLYKVDLSIKNTTGETTKVNNIAAVSSNIYLLTADGRMIQPAPIYSKLTLDPPADVGDDPMKRAMLGTRMATWPQELEAGQTAQGSVVFEVPDDAGNLMLAVDTGMGYSLTREGMKYMDAPIGVIDVAE